MIRPATSDDKAALVALSEASGLFRSDELQELADVLDAYFSGNLGRDHHWIVDEDHGLVGVAYYAPAAMADRVWLLYFIAVRPERRGQGRGASLVRHVEQALASHGERLLLVETSGLASFERTRAFYHKCGFDEEARIRDFYKPGDDKIIFRKELMTLEQ